MRWTGSYEGSGGAALVDTLIKALQISMDVYYFIYFQDCVLKVGTNSFQEVLEAVLFGVGVYLQQLTVGSFVGAHLG